MQLRATSGLIMCAMLVATAGSAQVDVATPCSFFSAEPQQKDGGGSTEAAALEGPVDMIALTRLAQMAGSGRSTAPARLALDLAPGLRETFEVYRAESVIDGTWALAARTADDADDYAILVLGKTALGEVSYQDRTYAVRLNTETGLHRIVEVRESIPIAVSPSDAVSFADVEHGQLAAADRQSKKSSTRPGTAKTTTYIDLLVVYDTGAKDETDIWGSIDQHITFGVFKTNVALSRSQVDAEIRLVHAAAVDYTMAGASVYDFDQALKYLVCEQGDASSSCAAWDPDGVMDVVHAMRDAYGADLVTLLVTGSNPCGLATLLEDIAFPADRLAFSISSVYYQASGSDCMTNHSFTHELGHTLGCGHAEGDGGPGNPDWGYYDYSHGHRHVDTAPEFRTVMAYQPPLNGAKLNFSNPDVDYCSSEVPSGKSGRIGPGACAPTGVAGEAENARTMEGPNGWGELPTKDIVADHRDERTMWADLNLGLGGGAVVRGDNLTLSVQDVPLQLDACNSGSVPLVIDNYYDLVSGERFSQLGDDPQDYRIDIGECWSFEVDFDADGAAAGWYPATVTLLANDADGAFSFTIDLQVPPPEIRVVVDGNTMPLGGTFDFPTRWVGDLPIDQYFGVCNDGTAELVISNPAGLVSGAGYTQIGNPPSTPLAAGHCTGFWVRFDVSAEGHYDGSVTLDNNDPDEDPFTFLLHAHASKYPLD